jgi:hypothetical protein
VTCIFETIKSKAWTPRDLIYNKKEECILQAWNLDFQNQATIIVVRHLQCSPRLWSPPPTGFIKINFNGASKGNLGPTRFGVVLRNSEGEILYLTTGYLGENKNNATELSSLLKGLNIALDNHYQRIIAEGYSQIIIHLIT